MAKAAPERDLYVCPLYSKPSAVATTTQTLPFQFRSKRVPGRMPPAFLRGFGVLPISVSAVCADSLMPPYYIS